MKAFLQGLTVLVVKSKLVVMKKSLEHNQTEFIFSTSLSRLRWKYPFKKLVVPCNKLINQLEEKGLSVQKCSQLMINLGTRTLNNKMMKNKLELLKSLSILCKHQGIIILQQVKQLYPNNILLTLKSHHKL